MVSLKSQVIGRKTKEKNTIMIQTIFVVIAVL